MPPRPSRRRLLALLGTVGLGSLAGCENTTDSTTTTTRPSTTTTSTPDAEPTTTTLRSRDLGWTQLPGPPGGPVQSVSLSTADPNWIYTTTKTAGVFVSGNGGSDWIPGFPGMHHRKQIWASPHDPEVAYTNLERTDTGGQQWYGKLSGADPDRDRHGPWIESRNGTQVYDMAWDADDPATIYAAAGQGFYRTRDDGRSWERLSIDLEVEVSGERGGPIATNPTQPGELTIGFLDGDKQPTVLRSTDYGDSWSRYTEYTNQTNDVRELTYADPGTGDVYFAVDGSGVFYSDGGTPQPITATDRNYVFPPTPGFATTADDTHLYFIAGDAPDPVPITEWWDSRNLYRYDPATQTVEAVSTPSKPSAVTTHPANPDTLYVGGVSWLHESTDGGQTWTALSNGFVDHYLAAVGVNPDQPGTVIPGSRCSSGISVSHDSGQTYAWKRSGLGPWHQGEFGEHYVMQIAAGGDYAYATTSAGLLISEDNGRSWRLLDTDFSGQGTSGGPNTHLHGLAVNPENPEIVYVGTGRGGAAGGHDVFEGCRLWKSTDGGDSWQRATALFPTAADTVIQDITINPHDPEQVLVGTNAEDYLHTGKGKHAGEGVGIWTSYDAGGRWVDLDPPFNNVHALAVDAEHEETIYASGPYGIYKTTTGGSVWSKVLATRTKALFTHPTEPGVVFAGSQRFDSYWDVLVSVDGAVTWEHTGLVIQAGRKPNTREYDARELHSDYWGHATGQPMSFAFDPETAELYLATNGVGLWSVDTTPLTQQP